MSIGNYTYGNPTILWNSDSNQFKCGKFCSISINVTIFLGGNHRVDWITTYPFGHIHQNTFTNFDGTGHPSSKGPVIVGNDVWIGMFTTIMSGVTIGDGVVIACNSHVVKNCEPYGIYGGNPAQLIKYRFSSEQIYKLLEIKWWNWTIEKINDNLLLLCNSNIDYFITKHFIDRLVNTDEQQLVNTDEQQLVNTDGQQLVNTDGQQLVNTNGQQLVNTDEQI